MHAWELTRYLIQNQIIIDKEPRRHRMLELIGYAFRGNYPSKSRHPGFDQS